MTERGGTFCRKAVSISLILFDPKRHQCLIIRVSNWYTQEAEVGNKILAQIIANDNITKLTSQGERELQAVYQITRLPHSHCSYCV